VSKLASNTNTNWYCICVIFTAGIIGLVHGCATTTSAPPIPLKDTATDQFTRGVRAFEEGQYKEAVARFQNVIAGHPGSPFLMEAQWHLAKSYIAMEHKNLAVRELDLFLANYPESRYQGQALILRSEVALSSKKVIATLWSPHIQPQLNNQLLHLNYPGINTILLEIPDDQLRRIAFSSGAPVAGDPLYEWINAIRKEKFRVIVKIPLRTMHWPVLYRSDWRDQKYDAQNGILQTTDALDLFHPEVKAMLLTLCRNIAAYPIDGIYIDQISYPMEEGWTPAAQGLYQNLFLEKLQLAHVFKASWAEALNKKGDDPTSVQFWRFAGLKSRYLADLLTAIHIAIENVQYNLSFGVGLPEMLLVDPLEGFIRSSLDYLQLKEVRFNFFVVTKRETVRERLYESLQKYGAAEDIWFEWDHRGGLFPPEKIPIQGIVVSGP